MLRSNVSSVPEVLSDLRRLPSFDVNGVVLDLVFFPGSPLVEVLRVDPLPEVSLMYVMYSYKSIN
jgi:hypothetical protein